MCLPVRRMRLRTRLNVEVVKPNEKVWCRKTYEKDVRGEGTVRQCRVEIH